MSTPRTDAAKKVYSKQKCWIDVEHARQLERERATAERERDDARQERDRIDRELNEARIRAMQRLARVERERDALASKLSASGERNKTLKRERDKADAEVLKLWRLVDWRRMEKPPCFVCGYNGPGYYQPRTHKCAKYYRAALAKEEKP